MNNTLSHHNESGKKTSKFKNFARAMAIMAVLTAGSSEVSKAAVKFENFVEIMEGIKGAEFTKGNTEITDYIDVLSGEFDKAVSYKDVFVKECNNRLTDEYLEEEEYLLESNDEKFAAVALALEMSVSKEKKLDELIKAWKNEKYMDIKYLGKDIKEGFAIQVRKDNKQLKEEGRQLKEEGRQLKEEGRQLIIKGEELNKTIELSEVKNSPLIQEHLILMEKGCKKFGIEPSEKTKALFRELHKITQK